jgi:hypothetical protein
MCGVTDALRMALAIDAHGAVATLPLFRALLAMTTITVRLDRDAWTRRTAMTMAAITASAAPFAALPASGGRQLQGP